MKRRTFITLLGGAAAAWPLAAYAQQGGKLATVGVMASGTVADTSHLTAAFVQRLRELGWIEAGMSRLSIAGARDALSALPRSQTSSYGSRSI